MNGAPAATAGRKLRHAASLMPSQPGKFLAAGFSAFLSTFLSTFLSIGLSTGLLLACLGTALPVFAQTADTSEIDPRDEGVPPPPPFFKDKLLALDMPVFMSLKFGIDPATISISPTRTVRYVVVATSASGASNVMYEGLRCEAGEFITYARQLPDGKWNVLANPRWRPLTDINTARHALAFARQGACEGRNATASSVAAIVRALSAR